MKLKFMFAVCGLAAACIVSGCVTSVDGRQQVGLPFANDRKEARYERSPMEIWTAAKDVLNFNGRLYSEDVMKSTLEAAVNTRTVWVKVEPVDGTMTRVIVQARTKGGAPDADLASEIDKQIALRLQSGNLSPAAPARTPGSGT
jgi:hypothetical protein